MKNKAETPERQIRANYNEESITVYQAYNSEIAKLAVLNNRFVPPFLTRRMTWIKPSFFWMMYRSGWATKKNQEHVLAIKISREGFETALENACISSFKSQHFSTQEEWQAVKDNSRVTIQWDPERDLFLRKLDYRSIQIGLSRNIVNEYINNWTVEITDITDSVHRAKKLIDARELEKAKEFIPHEEIYIPKTENLYKIGL